MIGVIVIIILTLLLIYYLTSLKFEWGTGFTEMKNKAREGKFTKVDVKKDEEVKYLTKRE